MRTLTEQALDCPYCGERISVVIDHSLGDQEYVEDCEVCCRPLVLDILIGPDGDASVTARYENA